MEYGFDNDKFENDYQNEIMINTISNEFAILNLLKEIEQFDKSTPNNSLMLINDINKRFKYAIARHPNNATLSQKHVDVLISVYAKAREVIGFDSVLNPDTITLHKFSEYVTSIVDFFINRYVENHVNYLVNEILLRRKHYIQHYKTDDIKNIKTPKLTSMRKVFKTIDNTIIIMYFEEIVNDILSNYIDTFIKSVVDADPDEYTNTLINNLFINNLHETMIGSNFVKQYALTNKSALYTDILFLVESKVRDIFLNKNSAI